MSRKRIAIPIRIVNGDVVMIEDEESDYQSLTHHLYAAPASHPLTRMLGTEFKYQVSFQTAMDCIFDLRMNMYRYEEGAILTDIVAVIDQDTLRVKIAWKSLSIKEINNER